MPLGCIGHWYTSLLYLAPVVGLVGFLSVKTRIENRRDAQQNDEPAHGDPLAAPQVTSPTRERESLGAGA
jgi:hypothetical protein